ncbi:MAG: hypothetical protein K2X47_11365 [Bdellovibrionales bacterium]|nr:hypothetical protein [Bdellovibrionales bacterium]
MGRPIVQLIRGSKLKYTPQLSMVLGLAVMAFLTSVFYRFGVTLSGINCFWNCLAAAGWVWVFWKRKTLSAPMTWAVYLGVAVLSLIPMILGGFQFAIVQGNHWDTFGYLESALVFAKNGYNQIQAWDTPQLLENPMFHSAFANLSMRPSVHILYGMLSSPFKMHSSQIYLAFLIFCSCQMFFVLLDLFQRLEILKDHRYALFFSAVYIASFWSQWTLDINAWSQISSIPIAVLATGLLVDLLKNRTAEEQWSSFFPLILPMAALLYLYPELFLFYGGAWGFLILFSVWVWGREKRNFLKFTGVLLFVLLLGTFLFEGVLKGLFLQTRFVVSTRVTWGEYFFAFLNGRDGFTQPFSDFMDSISGIVGFYFFTADKDQMVALAWIQRLILFGLSVSILCCLVRWLWSQRKQAWGKNISRSSVGLMSFLISAFLVQIFVFYVLHRYWAMGKAYSYLFPLLWLSVPLFLNFQNQKTSWLVVGILALQGLGFFARIQLSTNPSGVHYALPYPAEMDKTLKEPTWDLEKFRRDVDSCRAVLLGLENEWLQRPLIQALYVWEKPFLLEKGVKSHFGQGNVLGEMRKDGIPAVDCRVILSAVSSGAAENNRPAFIVERLAPSEPTK